MSVMFDTEKFLREKGVVDQKGNALPGFESHVTLQRGLDDAENIMVAATMSELDMVTKLAMVMARTTALNEAEELLSDTVRAVNFGPIFRYVRGLPE